MSISNCRIFARRMAKEGWYRVTRPTLWYRWKIFRWNHHLVLPAICPDHDKPCPYLKSFVPDRACSTRVIPPPIFKGHVKQGDD